MRVKICGITRAEDARAAVAAGADAIGLVFFAGSRRAVSIEQAREICAVVPPLLPVVGLFVDAEPTWMKQVLATVPLNLLQFHGAETASECEQFARPYIKAVPVDEHSDTESVRQHMQAYPTARGFLLDTAAAGQFGGSGKAFDWSLVPTERSGPVILAGGLHTDNVARAIALTRPAAVDVSSGVESAPGVKDPEKMQRFVAAARAAFKE